MAIEIRIVIDDNGRLGLSAPKDPIMALGLLEMAKKIVKDQLPKIDMNENSDIIVPRIIPPSNIGGGAA